MPLNAVQSEFQDLMNMAGFRPVDAARLLGVSKASVSKILSGKQTPRPHTMEIFRQKVAELSGRNARTIPGNLEDRMKYPNADEPVGAPTLREVYEDTKKKLAEMSQDPEAIQAVHEFVDYRYAKRKKRK